jgi:hypothetical protein
VSRIHKAVSALVLTGSTLLLPRVASAEITLVEKDGWTVYMNGRVQAFLNYNKGDGYPGPAAIDGNGQKVDLRGGGQSPSDAYHEYDKPPTARAATDVGKVEELRIRTGFVGNVLGFGIKKKLSESSELMAYTAVTTYIDSTSRRKYLEVRPDWRESFLRVSGLWGSLTAGRTGTLFSRGATEITYLYGFKYGLGWPGSVSSPGGSGPGAGAVGFGVLANGFGGGITYATPDLAGAQVSVGIYDANSLVGSGVWERTKWPRAETELTFERKLGGAGMFKLFGNGAWQKVYSKDGPGSSTIVGAGYGGRVEIGPAHLGLAGHYGKGVGMDFALQPTPAIWDHRDEYQKDTLKMRTFTGYYIQAMVSATKAIDISAGAGITSVAQTPEDKLDSKNHDEASDPMGNLTPAANDDGDATRPDSVGFATIKSQTGIHGGATFHLTENLHLALEYFRAMFQWYKPIPATAQTPNPKQNFHVINAGITYDW